MANHNEGRRLDKDGGKMINIKELTIGDEVIKVPYGLENFCGYFPRYTVKTVSLKPSGWLTTLETQKDENGNIALTSIAESDTPSRYFYPDEFEKAKQFAFDRINELWVKVIEAKEKISSMEG